MKAGHKVEVAIPGDVTQGQCGGEVYLTVSLKLKHSTSWAAQDHEVAWAQARLSQQLYSPSQEPHSSTQTYKKMSLASSPTRLTVSGVGFTFSFDTTRGALVEWQANGQCLIQAKNDHAFGIVPGCWRPATDNDCSNTLPYWQRFGVDALTTNLRSISVDESQDRYITITTRLFLTPPVLAWGWNCEVEYQIHDSGKLRVATAMSPTGSHPTHVPRIGFNLRLSQDLCQARWLGLGPGESYPDKKSAQRMGIWETRSINELHTPYDVPQENGNRMNTRWLTLTGRQGRGIRASMAENTDCGDGFCFAATRYSDETVQEAQHPPDLVEENAVLLRLDAKVAGVGTGACGPGVNEADQVKCRPYNFSFMLESV